MPYLRKDSAVWWISYTDASGKRIRCSAGTEDKKEATALENQRKAEAHQVKIWGKQPERRFDALMVFWLQSHADKKSLDRDKGIIKNLRPHFQATPLQDLAASAIRAYIAARKAQNIQNATINRELALLSAALNYAQTELEWQVPNPVKGRKLKEPEGRLRWLTHDQAARLLDVSNHANQTPYLPDFINLALNTGMRKEEMLGLEWNRVDLKQNLIHLEPQHTKTAKHRAIPVNQSARDALLNRLRFRAEHCPDSPWVFATLDGSRLGSPRKAFATAMQRAGITEFTIHDLRHTCAAWLVSAGAPLIAVRDLLGHSTIKMTERYAHLAPDNVRGAVSLLDIPNAPKNPLSKSNSI
jgi:integrase